MRKRHIGRFAGARGVCLLLAVVLLPSALVRAEGLFGSGAELQTGAAVRSWKIERGSESVDVSQTSFPILFKTPLVADGLVFTAFIAGASSEVDGADLSKLGAATDTELKLDYLMAGERVFLSGGASLPTGDTGLDEEGVLVSRAVSNQVLGFRTNRYGEGLDLFGDVALAHPFNQEWSVGGGGGFRLKNKYDFAPDTESGLADFDPGEELFVSGGASYLKRGTGATTSFNLDVTLRTYGEDQIEAEPVFQEGDEVEVRVAGSRAGERWRGGGMVRSVTKSDHEFLGETDILVFGSAVEDVILSNVAADLVQVSGSVGYRLTPAVTFTLFGHVSRFAEVSVADPDGDGDLIRRKSANVYEPGLSIGWRAANSIRITLGFSALGGDAEGGDLSISGFDVSGGASIGL